MDHATEQPERRGLVGFLIAVIRTATQPSIPGTIGALMIAASLFAAATITITPEFMTKIDPGMLMVDEGDQYGYLTVRAFHLAHEEHPDVPTAVLVGASGVQHAVPDEQLMTEMLSEKLGREARVLNLAVGGVTPWEGIGLVDFLDDNVKGVYLFNVSMTRLAIPLSRFEELALFPRIGFVSEALDREIELAGFPAPRRSGIYGVDNLQFLLARFKSLLHIVTGPVEIVRYTLRPNLIREEAWPAHIEEWLPFFRVYETNKKPIYDAIARMIERTRSTGCDVVLINGVINPRMMEHVPEEVEKAYERDMAAFIEEHGVEYWDLQPSMNYTPDEFYDRSHVRDHDARVRFGDLLTSRLAEYFRAKERRAEELP